MNATVPRRAALLTVGLGIMAALSGRSRGADDDGESRRRSKRRFWLKTSAAGYRGTEITDAALLGPPGLDYRKVVDQNHAYILMRELVSTKERFLTVEFLNAYGDYPPIALFEPRRSAPYFEKLLASKLGGKSTPANPPTEVDRAFLRQIHELAGDLPASRSPDTNVSLIEAPLGGDRFAVIRPPNPAAAEPIRGQLVAPGLSKMLKELIVVDERFDLMAPHLAIYLDQIETVSQGGWDVIALGRHGILLRKGDSLRIDYRRADQFISKGIVRRRLDSLSEPLWMQEVGGRRKRLPQDARLRSMLLAGLSVCSAATWRDHWGFVVNPGHWSDLHT